MKYNMFFQKIGFNCTMNIIRNFKIQCYKKNHFLFKKSELIKNFYIIIFGKVRLVDQSIRYMKDSYAG